ncbi:MAG: hypothetical protein J5I91_09565 [Bacteroidetes bacterium]|nr:hypothetical protein [Bacteroidota bacterium]
MKKQFYYMLLLSIVVVFGVFLLNSCNKESSKNNKISKIENSDTKEDAYSQLVCCQVTCKGGKCTSTQSPCTCTCSYWGDRPICSGGGVRFDFDQIHISNIDGMVSKLRSFNNYFADSAAYYFENFKNAVINDNQTIAQVEISKYDLVKVKMPSNYINQYVAYVESLDYE